MKSCVPKNCIVGETWNRQTCKCEEKPLQRSGVAVKASPKSVTKKPKLFNKGGMVKYDAGGSTSAVKPEGKRYTSVKPEGKRYTSLSKGNPNLKPMPKPMPKPGEKPIPAKAGAKGTGTYYGPGPKPLAGGNKKIVTKVESSNKTRPTTVTKKTTSAVKKPAKPKLQSDEKIMDTARYISQGIKDVYNSQVEGIKKSPGYKAYKYVKNAMGYKKGGSIKKSKK
jgi:hypothetical protein